MNLAFMLKVEGKIKVANLSRNLTDNPFMYRLVENNTYSHSYAISSSESGQKKYISIKNQHISII